MSVLRFLIAFMLLFPLVGKAQTKFSIKGTVLDETHVPLPGCHVHYGEVCVITNNAGDFFVEGLGKRDVKLTFTFIGYQSLDTLIVLPLKTDFIVSLKPDMHQLGEIAISVNNFDTAASVKNEVINSRYITENLSGTFIKSLDKIVGFNSMDMGANASKPVIRGMGFNRVVVSENGIKQENQQWGSDHGIEIDPFAIESAEVVKGASAIEYGSDALGGVINVSNNELPINGEFAGALSMLAKSVNNTLGGSFMVKQRHNKFFYKMRGSMLSFGDYAIPTDTIVYLTQKMPIYNQHLKNSAGNEFDLNGQWGIIGNSYKSVLSITNVAQKSGFFPGAHGIPNIEKLADDGDSRNVEFPFQQVNHFKAISNTKWFWQETVTYVDMGFQRNHRQEWSLFHSHYPGQEAPANNPDLELDFLLNTYSVNVKTEVASVENHAITVGIQTQVMDNYVGGYSFFLPEYKRITTGVYAKDEFTINENTKLFFGARIDYGLYSGAAYFDSLVYRYILSLPDRTIEDAEFYAQRSSNVNRSFPGTSWQIGATQKLGTSLLLRMNLGKAFRIPTAVELGANGVHHGSYRFEKGDEYLKTETGYNSDMHLEWNQPAFQMGFGAYAYYFTNYIYLQPTGDLSHPIPDAGGIYYYKQSKALISGLEFTIAKTFWTKLTIDANVELPYNYLITDDGKLGYGIPYSPPVNGYWELKYQPKQIISLAVNGKWALAKDRNRGQGEPETPGYNVFGCSAMSEFLLKGQAVNLIFQIQNVLNTKYFNSMSFYRKLDIPEQGRNFQVAVKIPFKL